MWIVLLLLAVVVVILLVAGVITTLAVWGGGSVLYMVINVARQARLSRELDTNSGIAPFISLNKVNNELCGIANETTVQMRVERDHRLSRRLALTGCAAILLVVLVDAGVASFIIGAVIGIPVAIFAISLLGKLPVLARRTERKVNRAVRSIIGGLQSPALAELQQITSQNADLSYRLGVNVSDGLQNVVDYFDQNTLMILDDPSLMEECIAAELAKSRQDNRRLEHQYWQGNKKDNRRSAHSGSDTGNEPTPYEVLGVRTDLPIEEIKKVYLELVKLYHPDKGIAPDGERLKKINAAWDRIREGRKHRGR